MIKDKKRNNENNELMVYKSNKLIEARYNLNLVEQKLLLFASSHIDSFKGDDFTTLKIPIGEFFKISGFDENSKNHAYIKNTAIKLMNKQLEIETKDGGWLLMNWVASCEYIPGTGTIELEFSNKMKPYMLKLKDHYKGYPLSEVLNLNSKYSIRLYELLIQWEYTSHKSLTIEVEELRKKLGIEDNEYERFYNFENRVIKTAVEELNNKSNIYATYEKIKEGRKISCIKFKFQVNCLEDDIYIQNLKKSGLANHIEEIKKLFDVDNILFTDLQIHESYEYVFNKLSNIDLISNFLIDAVYSYMLYYYNYTRIKAGKHAYKYYLNVLENDYDRIKVLYEFGRRPESIVFGEMV